MIALADLAEAEGRALRRAVLRSGTGLACLAAATVLMLSGIMLSLWAGYQYLSGLWGPIPATLGIATLMFIVAGMLAWITIRLNR